jgi:serine/threonine-protein kinase
MSVPLTPSRLARTLATLGWFTAIAAWAALVFSVTLYLTVRKVFVGREVTVPDVVSMPLDRARAALEDADLRLEVDSERYDEVIPAGAVRSQAPEAGQRIKPERTIRVSLSLGPVQVEVPDVRGQTLRTATIALQREGLPLGHVSFTHESSVATDLVMAQDPLPSEEGPDGTGGERRGWDGSVALLVSRGPLERQFVMPDLSNRSIAEVRSFVQRAGLRMGAVRTEISPGVPAGRVVRQYPRAGYPIGERDIISLVLSE